MAQVAKSGTPSLSTTQPCPAHHISGLVAGEAVAAGDACYVKSDGKVWLSTGAAVNAAAKVHGFAAMAAAVGEAVSLYFNVNFRYGAALTPGTTLYLSATAGTLSDVATTGGTGPIGFVIDATRVRLTQSAY